jgi:hypothetical protein
VRAPTPALAVATLQIRCLPKRLRRRPPLRLPVLATALPRVPHSLPLATSLAAQSPRPAVTPG